jgi:hypothetical protein
VPRARAQRWVRRCLLLLLLLLLLQHAALCLCLLLRSALEPALLVLRVKHVSSE